MKNLRYLLVAGSLLLSTAIVQAKAAFKGVDEMIKTADVIAIVNIEKVEKAEVKGKHWTYRQKAAASVATALKGSPAQQINLYGDEDFICAQCHFETGRYLVFLDFDGELLTGNNWHLSTYKVTGDKVQWVNKREAALADVTKEIQEVLSKAKTP